MQTTRFNLLKASATCFVLSGTLAAQSYSSLVSQGADGRLQYARYANEGETAAVNQMIDFSHAGYAGGGIAIPWVPVAVTLDPMPGSEDDFFRIQSAINDLSRMPRTDSGFRGALLLRAGTYHVSQTLRIRTDGVVIRGEGQGRDGTVIRFTATEQDNLFECVGRSGWTQIGNTAQPITDALVPSGGRTFRVRSAEGFRVGDRLMVHRLPNQAWIDLLEMGQWGWTSTAYRSATPRRITAIDDNHITVDASLVHAIDRRYGGGEVYRYQFRGAIEQVGIERLRLESTFTSATDENHGWNAIHFSRVENAWARQVTAQYFGYSCVHIRQQCQNITVEDCAQLDPKSQITGGRRYSFVIDDASFILVQRCYTENGRHDFVTQSKTAGPIAFVDCLARQTHSDIGPHHRYSEGVLFDNVRGGQINVQNREDSGTGHGWAGAQIVFWNCQASSFICDAPKGAMNFAIGCAGSKRQGHWAPGEPDGHWESRQLAVLPRSLYYQQLQDRLGVGAVQAVTTSGQRDGRIWTELANWRGEGDALGAEVGSDPMAACLGEAGMQEYPCVNQWLITETKEADPDLSEWDLDRDGDGLSARFEFALGGSLSSDDRALQPTLQNDSKGEVRYTFNRRQNGLPASAYQVQVSASLRRDSWEVVPAEAIQVIPHPQLSGFDQAFVRLPPNLSTLFVRLRVQ